MAIDKSKKNVRITEGMKEKARKTLKEPTFGVEQAFQSAKETRLAIQNTINWYNQHFETTQSKEWALKWIETHPTLSQYYKRFKAVPADWIGNKGFVCRMLSNGFRLDARSLKSLENAFLANLEMLPEEQEPAPDIVVKYTGIKFKEDPFWSSLVDVEDLIMAGKGKPDTLDEKWIFFHNYLPLLTNAEKKRAKTTLKRHRQQLVDDVNYAGENVLNKNIDVSRRVVKSLIQHYDKWLNSLQ